MHLEAWHNAHYSGNERRRRNQAGDEHAGSQAVQYNYSSSVRPPKRELPLVTNGIDDNSVYQQQRYGHRVSATIAKRCQ